MKTTQKLGVNITTEEHTEIIRPRLSAKVNTLDNTVPFKTRKSMKGLSGIEGELIKLELERLEARKESVNKMQHKGLRKEDEDTPRMNLGSITGPSALNSINVEERFPLQKEESIDRSNSSKSLSPKSLKANEIKGKMEINKGLDPSGMESNLIGSEIDISKVRKIRRFGSVDERETNKIEHKERQNSEEDFKDSSDGASSPPKIVTPKTPVYSHKSDNNFQSLMFTFSRSKNLNKRMVSDQESRNLVPAKHFVEKVPNIDLLNMKRKGTEEKVRVRPNYKSKIITHQIDPESREGREYQEYIQTEEEKRLRQALILFNKNKEHENKNEKESTNVESNNDNEEEEDEDEEKKVMSKKAKITQKKHKDYIEDNKDAQSSMTSASLDGTISSYYSFRAAIDEKHVPSSIRKMGFLVILVFLLLLAIATVFFVMQKVLYNGINKDIHSVKYSEIRKNNLIDMTLTITGMIIANVDYWQHKENPDLPPEESAIYKNAEYVAMYYAYNQAQLKEKTISLKDAQTELSLKSNDLSAKSLSEINPSNIELRYMDYSGSVISYNSTMWQAVIEIVVSGYRIAAMNISQVNDYTDSTVYFVMINAYNNILIHLELSSGAIMDEIENSRKWNIKVFIILLCVASGALLVSTILLIPILSKIKSNNQEVLELFMYIKRQNATLELNKCRQFLGSFQQNDETDLMGEEQVEEQDADTTSGPQVQLEKQKNSISSKRKFKKLIANLGLVIFEFLFLILIMEGYFLLNYFLSASFLNRVSSLTKELRMLVSRLSIDTLVVASVK